jgi:hypothetical protein
MSFRRSQTVSLFIFRTTQSVMNSSKSVGLQNTGSVSDAPFLLSLRVSDPLTMITDVVLNGGLRKQQQELSPVSLGKVQVKKSYFL